MKNVLPFILPPEQDRDFDPFPVIESAARQVGWVLHHEKGSDIATAHGPGKWVAYQLGFEWHAEIQALSVSAGFELRVPPLRQDDVMALVALANRPFEAGRFEVEFESNFILFRVTLLRREDQINPQDCKDAVLDTVCAMDAYYPAFMRLLFADRSPEQALEDVVFPVAGLA